MAGEAITARLEQLERTASWVYQKVGMTRLRWSRCLNGEQPFKHDEAEAIARVLKVSMRRLFPQGSVLPPGRQRQSPRR